ncbi:hypothetical protein VN97_g1952 [Penicillium thymicola]|uniref:Uncharacterized protein n=1 Tax=Penicillium thymicola TaxID=293382 RepID=A0AAI9TQI9_PENTH|nr:hypothetical protein VN97_g1952 [Penicillium thymicola]
MASQPHEQAACKFDAMINSFADEIKVSRRLTSYGATRIDTPERNKQADRSWKPTRKRRKFPMMALEVNVSETTTKLEKDIAWWINGLEGEVRIGITIDIKRRSGCIEIESWTPAFDPSLHRDYVIASGRHVLENYAEGRPLPQIAQSSLRER